MRKLRSYKPKPNYFWSVMSVAGVLFLLGIFTFITLHSKDLMDNLKEDFEVVVELSPTAPKDQVREIRESLGSNESVRPESVEYISKEEGLETLSKELGEEILHADMPNPLSDVITFNLIAEKFDPEVLRDLKKTYTEEYKAISGMYYQDGMIEQVIANLDRASYLFLIGGIILAVLALTLIHNSVRLALYSNRFLVKNMELVGASWNFIRKPFLWTGIKHGFASAVVALVALIVCGFVVLERVPELMQFLNLEYLLYLVLIIVGGGMLINLCSTFYVVTRFLKMRIGQLH